METPKSIFPIKFGAGCKLSKCKYGSFVTSSHPCKKECQCPATGEEEQRIDNKAKEVKEHE